ncbi:zf-TFIIB domain-containing protein [Erythrobacter sp. R86502]|uniref:TFIIB-type zinc ribbon-containing protein n=1 Tax=Erythrobacter sp. R86502 TaxID=3093846 RepID=UPI0036D394B4
MPLLLCPNDNSPMQTVDRDGVQFDMCPTCRRVWLDRGELEKLMAGAQDNASPPPSKNRAPPPQQPYYGDQGERGERGERGEYGDRTGYRKKRSSIFDIFD